MRDDPATMQRGQDFYQRYTSGPNTHGYDPGEAYEMYQRVGQEATPQQMQTALQQTVQNMTPQQRAEFGQMLQQRQQGQGTMTMPPGQDPGTGGLLGMIGNLFHGGSQGQPAPPTDHEGFLTHLFGGGQPAPAPASPQRDDQGSLFPGALDNPLAKVLVGGIAAYGAKQIADQYSKR